MAKRIGAAAVLGSLDDLPEIIDSSKVEEVWIALPARRTKDSARS